MVNLELFVKRGWCLYGDLGLVMDAEGPSFGDGSRLLRYKPVFSKSVGISCSL